MAETEAKKGRWTKAEHARFVKALEEIGQDWGLVSERVGTRNIVQVRTHAQKFFIKLAKANMPRPGQTTVAKTGSFYDDGSQDFDAARAREARKKQRTQSRVADQAAIGAGGVDGGHAGQKRGRAAVSALGSAAIRDVLLKASQIMGSAGLLPWAGGDLAATLDPAKSIPPEVLSAATGVSEPPELAPAGQAAAAAAAAAAATGLSASHTVTLRHVCLQPADAKDDLGVTFEDEPTGANNLPEHDHRRIAAKQNLFFWDESSPGGVFMLPKGTHLNNRLISYIRHQYQRRGYQEIQTPLLFRPQLWKTSGHWQNYSDDMFVVAGQEDTEESDMFGLKPMNCPGHCVVFHRLHPSYRELPLRLADFSPLHRNEATGALTGLTRVRGFHQDDAHIFCTAEQVQAEVRGCLDMVDEVYTTLGLGDRRFRLSTRPEKFVGDLQKWDEAEAALRGALESLGLEYEVDEGGGAFYGPKIDVAVHDVSGREHQVGTVQLDFQLPERFNLRYETGDSESPTDTPVIIHRAVLGSLERMLAILAEHYHGRWPLWMAPQQVALLPVADRHHDFARAAADGLRQAGIPVHLDDAHLSVSKKIRAAQSQQVPLMAVIGDREVESGSVAVRARDAVTAACMRAIAAQANIGDDRFGEFDKRLNTTTDLDTLVELLQAANSWQGVQAFGARSVPDV